MQAVVDGLDNYGCSIDFWDGCPVCGSDEFGHRVEANRVDGYKHEADCPYVALAAYKRM